MKRIVVTGCNRGLGLAISAKLLEEGYSIVGISRTLTAEYRELQLSFGNSVAGFLPFDLRDVDGIPVLVQRMCDTYGGIYGLVNNAAAGVDGVLGTLHNSEIDMLLTLNLRSPIYLTKYVARRMLSAKDGRIINISSIIARTGFSGLSVYAATKAGLEGFTRSLARECGRRGITVNCVAPGYMETDMTRGLQGERLNSIRRRSPLGLAKVRDVASAVAFLAGPEASRITGTILTVDGGGSA